MAEKPTTNIAAISKFFGKKAGGNLADFAAEVKDLTDEDKQQLGDGIRDGSLTY